MVALIVTPILFQRLGEEAYGLISLSLSVILLFGILVNYGFHLNGPKVLALNRNNSDENKAFINEVITTRLCLALFLAVLVYVLIEYLDLFLKYGLLLKFSIIILFAEAFYPMFIAQGLENLQLISKANVMAKLMYLCAVVFLVHSAQDAYKVNFYFGLSTLVANLGFLIRIYKRTEVTFYFASLKRVLFRLKDNFQYFLSTPAAYIMVSGGIIVLSAFVDEEELGQYALAQRIALLTRVLPVFYTQSILQKATRLMDENKESYTLFLKKNQRLGLFISALLGVLILILAPWIIKVVGGKFVEESAILLRILGFLPLAAMLNVKNTVEAIVTEQKQVLSKSVWVSTALMLLLSISGSYYLGGIGLAIALVLTDIINYWVHSYFLNKSIS